MAPDRETIIGQSVQHSILHSDEKPSFFGSVPAYFYIHWLAFECVREDLFEALRRTWEISQDDYLKSFEGKDALVPMGDMGYSGSTFFVTSDNRYLIKSIPRHFEHSFFANDLLLPYAEYMQNNPSGLLVRIMDFLQYTQNSVGSMSGVTPSHHIVMENIKYGQDQDSRGENSTKWESWDLKPMSYFYPERDVAGGSLSSEATKSKLADDFTEKLTLTLDEAEELKAQLAKDTRLLASCNAVDYSLFLVRIPASSSDPPKSSEGSGAPPSDPSFVPPTPPSWRTGVASADGKYIYRAALLDFFWAKHKVHAQAMTGLINTYNAMDRQGPMSVTTTATEYRERFLKMCSDVVEVKR